MMWGNGMGWGGWVLMGLTTIGFWAVVVFGLVALFHGTDRPASAPEQRRGTMGGDALRILDERFARGEIDAEEYRSRRSLLPPVG